MDRIDVKRMLELEDLKFSQCLNFNEIELDYINFALKMPIEEIREYLNLYDSSSPKFDEIKFIISLQTKYSVSREALIKRIKQVRQITKYEEGLKKGKLLFELKKK